MKRILLKIPRKGFVADYIDAQCNSKIDDYECAEDVNSVMDFITGEEERILDLGGGIGRASVYLSKRFKESSLYLGKRFHILDGDTEKKTQISGVKKNLANDFYSSKKAAIEFWGVNGCIDHHYWDASDLDSVFEIWDKNGMRFDLVYSFRAIGFHWPIAEYLAKLRPYVVSSSKLIFETRPIVNWSKLSLKDHGGLVFQQATNAEGYEFVQWRETKNRAFVILEKE